MQRTPYVKTCEICGASYEKPATCSTRTWATRCYCSRACTHQARRSMTPVQAKRCAVCERTYTRPSSISAVQWEARCFCSYGCAIEAERMERALCACGCGQRVAGPHHVWVHGHNYHTNLWRSYVDRYGRERWYVVTRSGRRLHWARVVMEDKIGRQLLPDEVVHHVNGDTSDDRPENLELLSNSDHARLHMRVGDYHQLTDAERRK